MTKYPNTQRSTKPKIPIVVDASDAWADDGVISDMILLETAAQGSAAKIFDLDERTARFGETAIRFAKRIPQNAVNERLICQFVGAATSIGANYAEADDGVSRKDFKNRIGTCKKEARETKYFLRMIAASEPGLAAEARELWREAKELHLIFCAIYRK